jgi:small GTP-binding protein
MYFQGCSGAIFVFDITRISTFQSIKTKWVKDYEAYIKEEGIYTLIGNKKDLEERSILKEQGQELANEIGAIEYIETSAKYNENVDKAFVNLIKNILNNYRDK